ncbi:putative K domain, prokaryotic type, K domain-like, alpha/beta protein [Medicago truncatula]|uniref:Putative K domain, prokaryotic type, K domain-like, alpha/beta protein n=1 Tax=Medicago truncatula TaxID=3880 RepID=A0A396JLP3_MEDTR|nr:putative K domain, prokaryotic type, K domain-like, alpha/beta protein [Medicago truncatula]
MKSLRIFKNTLYSTPSPKITTTVTTVFRAFFSAEPLTPEPDPQPEHSDATFDSSHYELPILNNNDEKPKVTWNKKYRDRTDKLVFGDDMLCYVMLWLEVGTKVAAVSRKTNTTTHEVVGVLTKGDTQICFFDTPGLVLNCSGFPYKDAKARVESAWSSVNLYEVLIVIFDVHRHITRPDSRVVKLIKRMGERSIPNQKRVLCMNKIDLVEKKKDLTKVAEEFEDLPGFERRFMISGMKGNGVKDLTQFLMEQAVGRPWEEDPFTMTEEVMKMISLEVVCERLLDHVHQEIPYDIEHSLIGWKELRDGSLRIEQHFLTNKLGQLKILVGKRGSKIGRIGIEANEELRTIFKKQVHLVLQVKLK